MGTGSGNKDGRALKKIARGLQSIGIVWGWYFVYSIYSDER